MTCPICKTPVTWQDNPARPFCSERCKLIDLGRWASGQYRIPGEKLASSPPDSSPTGQKPE
ncbi:MAG: DNA gyrase inhibitor YacG [Nitrospiraceae bacterium]